MLLLYQVNDPHAALCLPCLTDSADRVETNELISTDSSSGHTYMFCRSERRRFLNLALPVKAQPCSSHACANPNVRFLLCTAYLDGVIEDQGVKLCQVLHVVALDYVAVLSHQDSQLLHVEEQLCHLAGGKREEGKTKIARLPVRNLLR